MALRSVNDCLQLKRGEKRVLDDWRGEVELVGDVGRIDGRQRSIAHRSSSSQRCLYHWIRMWIANVHLLRNVVVENRIAVLLGEVHFVGFYSSFLLHFLTSDQIDRLGHQRNRFFLSRLFIQLPQLRYVARLQILRRLRLHVGIQVLHRSFLTIHRCVQMIHRSIHLWLHVGIQVLHLIH